MSNAGRARVDDALATEMRRLEFDVPAQERTKRSIQRTIRVCITVAVAAVGIVLICLKPEVRWPIAAVTVMQCAQALLSEYFNREDA